VGIALRADSNASSVQPRARQWYNHTTDTLLTLSVDEFLSVWTMAHQTDSQGAAVLVSPESADERLARLCSLVPQGCMA
jgi:hypothetical protein